MINNNTQKNTNTNTGTKSESSIYLKKSELPKNISSFKNDVGYISTSALDAWLKAHSYLSESEITTLINDANIVVIDTVNKSADREAIIRLDEKITSMAGEIVAIKDRLNNLKNVYISKEKESTFATKSQVNNISSKVNGIINTITGMDIDASGFATKDEIPTKVSQLKNDKGYLTEHQSLKDYAKKSDLPNFDQFVRFDDIDTQLSDELATKEWVNSKGFLTEHQSLADYAKKSNVYNKGEVDRLFLSENEASMLYPSKAEADKKYLSKSDANKEYLKIEDYRGLKDATIISDKYKDNSIDDFLKDVDKLMNGFYIVNKIDVVVVKDHKVLHIYSGSEQKLVWQEE